MPERGKLPEKTECGMVGLIPARANSKRIPRKNLQMLAGLPLVAIAIKEAAASGVFDLVACSSDSEEILDIAREYGAVPIQRLPELATDVSPDIDWVNHAIEVLKWKGDSFSILRPTNPFRTRETIIRAYSQFIQHPAEFDSLRAVELVTSRPEKMWRPGENSIQPYLSKSKVLQLHSQQSSTFEPLYVQNGCLEMAWVRVLPRSITGWAVQPFFTEGWEGIDINRPEDLEWARYLVENGKALVWTTRTASHLTSNLGRHTKLPTG